MMAKTLMVAIVGMNANADAIQSEIAGGASARCESLKSSDFSDILDAPTQIIDTQIVEQRGATGTNYCQVTGYVAPTVGFLLRLPHGEWNHKLLQLGCGGHCGSTDHIRQCDGPLRRGYACIVTDGGHKSTTKQALWAYNNWQGQIDYFVRASHVTALAGKAIAERYYGEAPRKAYFMGCSAGGREAMMQAQRFPWDFDGIIAGSPSLNQTSIRMNLLWGQRALTHSTGEPLLTQANIETLHAAVVARCDLNDGVKDGLVGDPRQCDFDPSELLCTASRHTECLTSRQVDGIRKLYEGPTTSTRQQIYPPGALRGSEKTWHDWFGTSVTSGMRDFVQEAFRYYAFQPNPGMAWKVEDFDFDRDHKRLALADSLYAAVNPDLRKFKAVGGKLLAYTGWNDAAGMPLPVIDYYETAEKLLGGRSATQAFFRLFVIPGMNHCSGGEGAFAVDYLSYLEAWVERGQLPTELRSFHVSLDDTKSNRRLMERRLEFPLDPVTIEFSRPVYPYPILTRYRGYGDPNDAMSFYPVEP